MFRLPTTAALTLLLTLPSALQAQDRHEASRGEMLCTTHCIACHSDQMHWRSRNLAVDRSSLQAQVRRWQAVAGLAWTEA